MNEVVQVDFTLDIEAIYIFMLFDRSLFSS